MKTDLAPKFLYYYALLVFVIGLVVVGIIHQYTMDFVIKQNEFFPFICTSVIWTVILLGLFFIINKCRYITINPTDENKFIIGNILTNSHGQSENLKIVKKVWPNLFKVTFEGKNFFMFSFDKTVNEFKQQRDS